MRNPIIVLNSLSEHSEKKSYKFERLYRLLFNEDMFSIAYQRIYAKPGNMTSGSDGSTIDQMSVARIENLIGSLRNETYQPTPAKRTYIKKKNGKMRPLGIPSFDDKLVQEAIRMILEAIFERQFENSSHGFRPNRSCHTALTQINKTFTATKWFIEGDIKGFFDNINHNTLIVILSERIADQRFLRLIRKFLNAGYMEDWIFHKTYSGTPQGGIVSPILANIYLDKLDKYMKDYISRFDKGEGRKVNPEYTRITRTIKQLNQQIKNEKEGSLRLSGIKQRKNKIKERCTVPGGIEMDQGYRRAKYVRYADDFLIGVIGSKSDCEKIKEDLKAFLQEKLALELSDQKTLITHANDAAKFLGYEVSIRDSNTLGKRNRLGHIHRTYNKKVVLKVSISTIRQKLFEYDVLKLITINGVEKWKPKGRTILINNDDLEILDKYNSEIRGFYNYFSLANNSSAINNFKYIMEYSMYKTLGRKYRKGVGEIKNSHRLNKDFAVKYMNKKGEQKVRLFYNEGFKRKKMDSNTFHDNMPTYIINTARTSLIDRLKAQQCEYCGSKGRLEMHHVRKLKDLKGKEPWEVRMIARKRKTLAVCQQCHRKIHAGKID